MLKKMKKNKTFIMISLLITATMFIKIPAVVIDTLLGTMFFSASIFYVFSILPIKKTKVKYFPKFIVSLSIFQILSGIIIIKSILIGTNSLIINNILPYIKAGNPVIGFFLVLTILMLYLILANGSSRLTEVIARFSLDTAPIKHMEIDADLGNGIVSENEAKRLRKKIDKEVTFFENVHGVSGYIKGPSLFGFALLLVPLLVYFIAQILTLEVVVQQITIHSFALLVIYGCAGLLIVLGNAVSLNRYYYGIKHE